VIFKLEPNCNMIVRLQMVSKYGIAVTTNSQKVKVCKSAIYKKG
jgi:hypothetical protein